MTVPQHDQFSRRLTQCLDDTPLTPYQALRLQRAREAALAAAQAPRPLRQEPRRRWALGFMLALVLGSALFWAGREADHLDDEIDTMLLADELPPDVYLDDQLIELVQES
ncbi:DUF3619 family protein [Chitinimonas lacunae]|uniref:DUF3619 family protein n=1 Tax=Chitinimonas lacunae TaxID=1963018 RepID=A0ABV8MTB3_9NEIS